MTIRPADRNRDLAAIHVLAAQLGMDTSDRHPASEYRAMLYTVGGPTARRGEEISAAHLDHVGRRRVVQHLTGLCRARGLTRPPRHSARPTPAPDRALMVRKICAMLREAGRGDEYADGMAKRMFHVARFEWLQPAQMHSVVAALEYDRGRCAARAMRAADGRA